MLVVALVAVAVLVGVVVVLVGVVVVLVGIGIQWKFQERWWQSVGFLHTGETKSKKTNIIPIF